MASIMDMLRMATGGMAGAGTPMAVPPDGAMGPTIGPGMAAPQALPPQGTDPGQAMLRAGMGMIGKPNIGAGIGGAQSGILSLLRGQSPQGILGVLQQISRGPQQQGSGGLMTAFQPQLNPGEPQLPGGNGGAVT